MATQDDIDRLQADLASLNLAITGGEKQTVINGESVTYRSIDELRAARDDTSARLIAAQASVAGVARPARRAQMIYGGRGYNDGCQ